MAESKSCMGVALKESRKGKSSQWIGLKTNACGWFCVDHFVLREKWLEMKIYRDSGTVAAGQRPKRKITR